MRRSMRSRPERKTIAAAAKNFEELPLVVWFGSPTHPPNRLAPRTIGLRVAGNGRTLRACRKYTRDLLALFTRGSPIAMIQASVPVSIAMGSHSCAIEIHNSLSSRPWTNSVFLMERRRRCLPTEATKSPWSWGRLCCPARDSTGLARVEENRSFALQFGISSLATG